MEKNPSIIPDIPSRERESIPLEVYVEEFINSEKILALINRFPEKMREDLLGVAVEVATIEHETGYEVHASVFAELLRTLNNDDLKTSLDYENIQFTIARSLWRGECETNTSLQHVDLVRDVNHPEVQKFWKTFCQLSSSEYHGCSNGVVGNISKDGLRSLDKFDTDSDLAELKEILEAQFPMSFSWGSFQQKAVYTSDTPGDAVDYAYRSPEWFSGFVGGSMNYLSVAGQTNVSIETLRTAYPLRDKEGCLRNLHNFINQNNIEDSLQTKIYDIFEKYWVEYNNTEDPTDTYLLIVEKQNSLSDDIFESLYEEATKNGVIESQDMVWFQTYRERDKRHESVNPELIKSVRLPNYKKLFPEQVAIYQETYSEQ